MSKFLCNQMAAKDQRTHLDIGVLKELSLSIPRRLSQSNCPCKAEPRPAWLLLRAYIMLVNLSHEDNILADFCNVL